MLNVSQPNPNEVLINTTHVTQGVSFRVHGLTVKQVKAELKKITGTTRQRALALRDTLAAQGFKIY